MQKRLANPFAVWIVVDSGGLKEAQVQSYSPGDASACALVVRG